MKPKILALAICTAIFSIACTQQYPVPLVKSSKDDRTEATASHSLQANSLQVKRPWSTRQRPSQSGRVVLPAQIQPAQVDLLAHPGAGLQAADAERYGDIHDNLVKRVSETPISTFSIDVDTGAYANVRRFLKAGQLPPHDAVRIEELLNYFSYDYERPQERDTPFSINTQVARSPWNENTHLLQVGIAGYDLKPSELPSANLVFLIDVSGSMRHSSKIGLLKRGLKMLAERMRPQDQVSIVVYAGASGVVLEPTSGDQKARIAAALNELRAGGSTNGAAGIRLAYEMARRSFVAGGVNRIVLATDGDFNVGTTSFDALKQLVERERETGVSLTTLGFGAGNYNEHLMEQLANAGNGNYAYIDSEREAHKVLVEQMAGTLATIAKDVKIQIEFNPAMVSEYRLIGYVNRKLAREDFDNDKVEAGEIGAGHTVTALYEVALNGSGGEKLPPLRFGRNVRSGDAVANELAHLRVRYKLPGGMVSKLIERPLHRSSIVAEPSASLRFAAAVAGFGQLLRGGRHTGEFGFEEVAALAESALTGDRFGRRQEFIQLANQAAELFGGVSVKSVALIGPHPQG